MWFRGFVRARKVSAEGGRHDVQSVGESRGERSLAKDAALIGLQQGEERSLAKRAKPAKVKIEIESARQRGHSVFRADFYLDFPLRASRSWRETSGSRSTIFRGEVAAPVGAAAGGIEFDGGIRMG